MKLILKIVLLLFLCNPVLGQNVKMIHKGLESDSSFYHIEKVNDNEFWQVGSMVSLKRLILPKINLIVKTGTLHSILIS